MLVEFGPDHGVMIPPRVCGKREMIYYNISKNALPGCRVQLQAESIFPISGWS